MKATHKGSFGSLAHLGFPEPVVEVRPTSEGGWLLRSPHALQAYPVTLLHRLQQHAVDYPERLAMSEKLVDMYFIFSLQKGVILYVV